MKFKLEENFGRTLQEVFTRRGYDCLTVCEERLGGATDERVLGAASSEGRILVTLDHDFGNVLLYPPDKTSGIAILNPPGRISNALLRSLAETLLTAHTLIPQ